MTSNTPLLEFNNATVVLKDKRVLDSISFRIDAGENIAIIGPNGSGKSALIKTITREYYPLAQDGHVPVRILGESTWNVFDLRSHLGIVSNELQQTCARYVSGHEMVLSGFFGSIGVWPNHRVSEEMERKAKAIMEFLEIIHLADKDMVEMSTGEARKVLIGRALVHGPQAMMLDEPINGLDPHAARKFSSSLRKIAASGKSVIMVTHHLQDIIPEISRIIMIKDGKLFRDGNKEEVLTEENLSELFHMPVEITRRGEYYHLWG